VIFVYPTTISPAALRKEINIYDEYFVRKNYNMIFKGFSFSKYLIQKEKK